MIEQEIELDISNNESTIVLLQSKQHNQRYLSVQKKGSIKTHQPERNNNNINQQNNDQTIQKGKKKTPIQAEEPILIEDLMQMTVTIAKNQIKTKKNNCMEEFIKMGDDIIWSDNSIDLDEDEELRKSSQQRENNDKQNLEKIDEKEENKISDSIYNYYRQEKYQLQIIDDGNFNNGGVSLQIDFDKKIIKAVKHVKAEEYFFKEIRALQEFQKKSCYLDEDVSLRLLDYDTNNLIFSQKAGFISFKQIIKIVQLKKLQEKYKLPFEYFFIKQLFFLLKKLDAMNNQFKIAHSDIKPNNIVIGFDFVPFFIDFGGAIFIQEQPNDYLTLCTPSFVPQKYLNQSQFDEQTIKNCEKSSLILTFLYMLCRNTEENKHFFKRNYKHLFEEFKQFYSIELISILESAIIQEDLSNIENKLKDILDRNLVSYIENLESILQFLNELKQFEYISTENLYIIKEWDQFNTNIIKLFPTLQFEIDLLEISQNQQIYDYFCQQNKSDIFINVNKPFFIKFINIFLEQSDDCHTLKLQDISSESIQDKYRVCDVISKSNGFLNINLNFSIFDQSKNGLEQYSDMMHSSCKFFKIPEIPALNFNNLKSQISCLQIISFQFPLDFKYFKGLHDQTDVSNLQELKIKCKYLNINLFQEFLNNQVQLRSFHVKVIEDKYKITFPKLATNNQLFKLKSNFTIINLDNVVEQNVRSLLDLEIIVNAGENDSQIYSKLTQLHFLGKISLRVHLIKNINGLTNYNSSSVACANTLATNAISQNPSIGLQKRKCSNSTFNLSQDFYDFLNSAFSKMRIPIIKLNFTECLLNSQDILQINRCIKSSSTSNNSQKLNNNILPHTLKLNLKVQSKPIEDVSAKMILVSLMQTKISRIKVLINNKGSVNSILNNAVDIRGRKLSSTIDIFSSGFKNESLKSFSLHLSNFNINVNSLVQNLTGCEKFKIMVDGYNQQLLYSLEQIEFSNPLQSLVIKPTDPILDKQFNLLNFCNPQISPSLKGKISYVNAKFQRSNKKLPTFLEQLENQAINNMKNNDTSMNYDETPTNNGCNNPFYLVDNPNQELSNIREKNQKIDDYIDFKSNKLFSINLFNLKSEINSEQILIQDSLSGLFECFRLNEKLTNVKLDFTACCFKKIIKTGFQQNLFDSFKYNKIITDIDINFSGYEMTNLKFLHSCLSYNENLKNITINLENCNLSTELLLEISEAILSNDSITSYKFNLLNNPDLDYVHSIVYELKNAKPNTDILLLFNNVKDYDLIIQSGIINYPPSLLSSLEIIQKQRKYIKHFYSEYEDIDNNNYQTFLNAGNYQNYNNANNFNSNANNYFINNGNNFNNNQNAINVINPERIRNQYSLNSPIFNHRKYSQQSKQSSLSNRANSKSNTTTSIKSQSQFSTHSAFYQNNQPIQNQSVFSLSSKQISMNYYNSPGLKNSSVIFNPLLNKNNSNLIFQKEDTFQLDISPSQNTSKSNNQNISIFNTESNDNEIETIQIENTVSKKKGIWISRKINGSNITNKLFPESFSTLVQSHNKFDNAQLNKDSNSLIEIDSDGKLNQNQSFQQKNENLIFVYHKRNTKLTLIMEDNQNLLALEDLAKKNQGIKDIHFTINESIINLKYFMAGLKYNSTLQGISIQLVFQPKKSDLKIILDILNQIKDQLIRIKLDFAKQKIGQENIKYILENLNLTNKLEEINLDFSHNMIQPNTAKYFQIFKESSLKKLTLDLGNNYLGIDGTKYICDLIEANNPNLEYLQLGLDFNFVGNSALELIQNSLSKNNSLKIFNIQMKGNQIKTEFASFFDSYLQTHPTIKEYSLKTDNCTIN